MPPGDTPRSEPVVAIRCPNPECREYQQLVLHEYRTNELAPTLDKLKKNDLKFYHIICDHCGRVLEFFEPRIEALQDEVAARYGFVLLSHSHQMRGICRRCRPRAKPDAAAAAESSGTEKTVPISPRLRG